MSSPVLYLVHSVILGSTGQIIKFLRVLCFPYFLEGTQEHEEVQDDQSETEKTRMKRDDVYKGNIYIEAMLTADKTTCDFYGNETLDYLLNIANLVMMR